MTTSLESTAQVGKLLTRRETLGTIGDNFGGLGRGNALWLFDGCMRGSSKGLEFGFQVGECVVGRLLVVVAAVVMMGMMFSMTVHSLSGAVKVMRSPARGEQRSVGRTFAGDISRRAQNSLVAHNF